MKITLSHLRKIIRETLEEESWPPGRWYPGDGEPVSIEDLDSIGHGGMGSENDEDEEHHKSIGEAKRKKKKKGLWANIHAKRQRGEPPAKPGDEGYPKTLDI